MQKGCISIDKMCIRDSPVDSREASLEIPKTLEMEIEVPTSVAILDGFIDFSAEELETFLKKQGLAMTLADLEHVQNYFKNEERRNPTITEIKVLDTYWSCLLYTSRCV